MSIDILIKKIQEKDNPSVVGLDPRIEYVPSFIRQKSYETYGKTVEGITQAILEYNKGLIDKLYDIIPAVKPQSAYYEIYGSHGVKVLEETIRYAKAKDLYVITDVKRNDIGSTAEAYAEAYLGSKIVDDIKVSAFNSDSITINPYLGIDGVAPFLNYCENNKKSIFILVKTSNKSSGELQDLMIENESLYERVSHLVNKWGSKSIGENGYSNVGAVVGATYPKQAAKLRKFMPKSYFLVPGYGAQGGTADDILPCFNNDGLGAIINSSRGIICAYINNKSNEEEYAIAARKEAIIMRNNIRKSLEKGKC